MYKMRHGYKSPSDPNIRVWRYVDFTKFMSLLHGSRLHFARLDSLADPFEGATPFKVLKRMFDSMNWEAIEAGGHDPDSVRQDIEESMLVQTRQATYVNCWHMGEHESTAMWKVYSGEGLAIQSTYRRLQASFDAERDRDIYIGQVVYIDPAVDDIPGFRTGAPLCKRKAFDWERELRAVYLDVPTLDDDGFLHPRTEPPHGISVQVNLKTLIEAVYIAPTRPAWFSKLVENMLGTFGLGGKPVHASSLDTAPVYFQK